MSAVKHFDITQLPSLKDGMSVEEENTQRRKTCRFIEQAGRILKLSRVPMSTAMVFFHRFYAKHSFKKYDRFEVAMACLVLAAKTEESPKKVNLVITECHKLKQRGLQAQQRSGSSSPVPLPPSMNLDPKGEEFIKLKERILLLERVALHTVGFELSIAHPHTKILMSAETMIRTGQVKYATPPPPNMSSSQVTSKMMDEIMQFAMTFANDSLHTSLCLQFTPQEIATACVYLAGQFAKVEPTTTTSSSTEAWVQILGDPNVESLASICIQLLDCKSDTESIRKVRTRVEAMRQLAERTLPSSSQAGEVRSPNAGVSSNPNSPGPPRSPNRITGTKRPQRPPPPPPPPGQQGSKRARM